MRCDWSEINSHQKNQRFFILFLIHHIFNADITYKKQNILSDSFIRKTKAIIILIIMLIIIIIIMLIVIIVVLVIIIIIMVIIIIIIIMVIIMVIIIIIIIMVIIMVIIIIIIIIIIKSIQTKRNLACTTYVYCMWVWDSVAIATINHSNIAYTILLVNSIG